MKDTRENRSLAEHFIRKYDRAFSPPISDQIGISSYVEKVFTRGHFCGHKSERSIQGLIGFYCNDSERQAGYISYLAVDEKMQGKGIGAELIEKSIEVCRNNGMKKIKLKTWNTNLRAIRLYERAGFHLIDEYTDDFVVDQVVLEKEIT